MARGEKFSSHSKARSCDGKKRYDSKTAAEKAMRGLYARKLAITRMVVYPCKYCGGFHVGHKKFGKK